MDIIPGDTVRSLDVRCLTGVVVEVKETKAYVEWDNYAVNWHPLDYLYKVEPTANKKECIWSLSKEGILSDLYDTSCGHVFVMIDGAPSENQFRFCPYCGSEISCEE